MALTPDDVERVARRVVELLREEVADDDRWLNTRDAAAYAGCSVNALHRAMAERSVDFAQEGPGAKAYFKRSMIDRWRSGS